MKQKQFSQGMKFLYKSMEGEKNSREEEGEKNSPSFFHTISLSLAFTSA
jgi:hypothetical protein